MAPPSTRSVTERTARAGIWTIAGKLVGKIIDLITLLILARLLSVADFGLVAMAMTPIFIIDVVLSLPTSQALIRIASPTAEMFDTAFTLSLGRGVVVAALLIAAAYPISAYYNEPRLPALMAALSLAPALRGLMSPRMATFAHQLDFRRDFIIDGVAKAVSLLVAVGLAMTTKSYWSIAAGTIATSACIMVTSFLFAPYRPALSLKEWPLFADMVGWNTAAQVAQSMNWQLSRILLPRFIDLSMFGRYTMASTISEIPEQALMQPVARPLMAAFTKANSNNNLAAAYLKAMSLITLVMAPLYLSLALMSKSILGAVLGTKWAEAGDILTWLCIISIVNLPTIPMSPLAFALDKTRYVAIRTGTELAVKLPVMIFAVHTLGIYGALLTQALACGATLFASMLISRRLCGISVMAQLGRLKYAATGLVPMGIILYFGNIWISAMSNYILIFAALLLVGSIAVAVYLMSAFGLWRLCGQQPGGEQVVVSFLARLLHAMKIRLGQRGTKPL